MSNLNLKIRSGKFTKKFRIVAAIEQENVLLLNRLLTILNHDPKAPVDKLGNNLLHVACYLGKFNILQFIYTTYNLPLNEFNTDGEAPIHLAIAGCNPKVVKWLWENGADCHAQTQLYKRTPLYYCCEMIKDREYFPVKKKLIKIKQFLMEKYFEDMRGYEIRKFLWVVKKLREKDCDIGKLSNGIIREIAEYI